MDFRRLSPYRLSRATRLVLEVSTLLGGLALFVTQPVLVSAPATTLKADETRLERDVRVMAVENHPRNQQSPGLEATARYIESEFRATGAAVSVQPYVARGIPVRNVIARFGPPQGPVIVIGAHYDSHFETPGADDNASGVAGLLELARLLSKQPPSVAVELVAFTLEEPPFFRSKFMGSHVHAQSMRGAGIEVKAMISLEMIGYFQDAPGSQSYPIPGMSLLYPSEGDFIGVVSRPSDWLLTREVKASLMSTMGAKVRSFNAPAAVQGVDFSDHRSYWAAGYPAVMVTDTSFLRNKAYHEDADTPERLDYARMARVVEGMLAYVHRAQPD